MSGLPGWPFKRDFTVFIYKFEIFFSFFARKRWYIFSFFGTKDSKCNTRFFRVVLTANKKKVHHSTY